jgi:multiple sugar transport system permease protein
MAGLLAPSLVLIVMLNLYPLLFALNQSAHSGSIVQLGEFVGLANYQRMVGDERLWRSALVTLVFVLVGVLGSAIVGLVFALALRADVPGRKYLRMLLLLPWIVPVVTSAATWKWLATTSSSPVRALTRSLGLGDVLFLADPSLALATLCAFRLWVSFPFMLMMFSASLEAIDKELYEAARVDGASRINQFMHITWPLIKRPTYVSMLLMTIFAMNDFGSVYLLTGGGPIGATTTLPVLAYTMVFKEYVTGPGVSVGVMMSAALVVLSLILYRMIRRVQ